MADQPNSETDIQRDVSPVSATAAGSGQDARLSVWRQRLKWPRRIVFAGLILVVLGGVAGLGAIMWAFATYGGDLPDYQVLAEYEPPVVTHIHAADGSLLTEFARERRLFAPINTIPEELKFAFISAEDKNFYEHFGLDLKGIVRAALTNVRNAAEGRRLVGASTISQQVARVFFLSNAVRFERKIKEQILTLRIERAFTKDQILELYLNQIYLGNRSYGVASAALNYFDKSLDELTLAEMAYLAAIPKGPNNYHPVRNKERALARRNWVLGRMYANGYISERARDAARTTDLVARPRGRAQVFAAGYFLETVRQRVAERYSETELYEGGLSVRTSLDPRLQEFAETALRDGLIAYDRRHGWRGPLAQADIAEVGWLEALKADRTILGDPRWRKAIVLGVNDTAAEIAFEDRTRGTIALDEVKWARPWVRGQSLGPRIKRVQEVLSAGDIIAVEPLPENEDAEAQKEADGSISDDVDEQITKPQLPAFGLRQIPDVSGALVAIDPHTGRVRAMAGGFSFQQSQFNRAVQAKRQPGSALKPIIYAAGLEAGLTPATLVLDAPFALDQGNGQGIWKPRNSSRKFYGPSTLRLGLEKSRNLMTVRLAQYLGMDKVRAVADRFGVGENMGDTLAFALGAGEVTPLELTAAYASFVNGGKRVEPTFIDRIQDRHGSNLYRSDQRDCLDCGTLAWNANKPPVLADTREQVIDPRHAYQIAWMLEGVVQRGTGRRIRAVGKPLAGKTGTTNDAFDTWFVGFSPDLVVGVYAGFDNPRSLGRREEGSSVAAPIFKQFMAAALQDVPAKPFRIPTGLRLVRVNAQTGLPATRNDPESAVIFEAFLPGTEPRPGESLLLDGGRQLVQSKSNKTSDLGGIY